MAKENGRAIVERVFSDYKDRVIESPEVRREVAGAIASKGSVPSRRVVIQATMVTSAPLNVLEKAFAAVLRPTGAEVRVFEEPV